MTATLNLNAYNENLALTSFKSRLSEVEETADDLEDRTDDLEDRTDDLEDKVYLYSSYVSGASWYKLYSDGFLMQGGTLSNTGSWGYTSVTFPHSFKNTSYQVLTTTYNSDTDEYTDTDNASIRGAYAVAGAVQAKSTSAFSVASWQTKMWVAFGQANL